MCLPLARGIALALALAGPLGCGAGPMAHDAGPPPDAQVLPDGDVDADGGPTDVDGGVSDAGVEPACLAYEANENQDFAHVLGDIDDASRFPSGNLSAGIASGGDEDWFSFHDEDKPGGFLFPGADLVISGSGNLDLCVYFVCDAAGTATISCAPGTEPNFAGLDGCCSIGLTTTESVRVEPDCPGLDDSGTVYVRVYADGTIPACESYGLAWGDD